MKWAASRRVILEKNRRPTGGSPMTIPRFDANGNLPPGVHKATVRQVVRRFGWNGRRRRVCAGLEEALANLVGAGVERVWIDGSFVTAKELPNDVDGCWDYVPERIDVSRLDPVFLDFDPPRIAMKKKYGVDFMISWVRLADPEAEGGTVLDFFQRDEDGNAKGILLLELGYKP
jgi:hypothetical protein